MSRTPAADSSTVDGELRQASPWPAWSITTRIDARAHWECVWRAVRCHETQMSVYDASAAEEPAGTLATDEALAALREKLAGGK